ncbi:hypothetical protein [Actinoplanes sp. NPDC049681]|uniref:hypothetical protein n=1 Tax=Actinoplanes sp. NPDC049681 TaxID=3363905 RepID=UPI0037AD38F8
MKKPPKRAEDRDTRLRLQARLNNGVVPVPFLGQTWQSRGSSYWRRRLGAVIVFLAALALVGGMAIGFTIGIVGAGDNPLRLVLAAVYDLTVVLGVRSGLRKIADAPLDTPAGTPRTFVPNGLLALALAPYGTGLIATMLIAMFGRDFLGERRAREISDIKH